MVSLRTLDNFGNVAAEDDAVLDYFLTTENVSEIEENKKFLVLGRKGAGKTAIVRYFTEASSPHSSRALNLKNYPWNVHASRIDRGASEIEAYVASWRYLIAVEVASLVVNISQDYHDEKEKLKKFLTDNYGGTEPAISNILRPNKLKLSRLSINPSLMGTQLGGIELNRTDRDQAFGFELNALTGGILSCAVNAFKGLRLNPIFLHFDELDSGLQEMDDKRKAMLVGLIIAARDLRREFNEMKASIHPAIYLRSDIWDDLSFSDKNKISQSLALHLEWDRDSLLALVQERLRAKLGAAARWEEVTDKQLMRGSQPKWNHIVARTLLRPRDVIQFLNVALGIAKRRSDEPLIFTNKDIVNSRNDYSSYLKRELDDEIIPHWPEWEEALQACSAIATETFQKAEFLREYSNRKSSKNSVGAEEALQILHKFSVIGYRKGSGYGGSGWAFLYEEPDLGWDSAASLFKVHPGLKEYAKLREKRESYF